MVAKKKTGTKTTGSNNRLAVTQLDLPEEKLGERVKLKRTSRGLTHDGLSDLTRIIDQEGRGISRTSIRGYELGTYKPGAREMRILSLALEVSPTWLLFGGDNDKQAAPMVGGSGVAPKFRWADLIMPLLSFSQLDPAERKQVRELIETLYRLQIGEVKFRSMKAFVVDFIDIIQDAVRDGMERGDFDQKAMRQVLTDTAAEMRKKHGDVEADVLMATLEPLLATLPVLKPRLE